MAIKEYLRRVFPGTAEEFCQKAGDAMVSGKRLFVITANPEILMHAGEDPAIREMLLDEETAVVPDGISVVKAMNLLGFPAKERITGVDLAEKLLKLAGQQGKSVYLLGAKEEVVSALAKKLRDQYPQMARSATRTDTGRTRTPTSGRLRRCSRTWCWWPWACPPRRSSSPGIWDSSKRACSSAWAAPSTCSPAASAGRRPCLSRPTPSGCTAFCGSPPA